MDRATGRQTGSYGVAGANEQVNRLLHILNRLGQVALVVELVLLGQQRLHGASTCQAVFSSLVCQYRRQDDHLGGRANANAAHDAAAGV